MLSSVEHEILNAHKYKNIKKFGIDKPRMLFFPLINVKMPKISCSVELSMKKSFITSGPGFRFHCCYQFEVSSVLYHVAAAKHLTAVQIIFY